MDSIKKEIKFFKTELENIKWQIAINQGLLLEIKGLLIKE
jgi:hypothetical protein